MSWDLSIRNRSANYLKAKPTAHHWNSEIRLISQ
jgi:hypothetical protein